MTSPNTVVAAKSRQMEALSGGRIAGLYPAWWSAGSGAWEYELELRRWPDRRRLAGPDG